MGVWFKVLNDMKFFWVFLALALCLEPMSVRAAGERPLFNTKVHQRNFALVAAAVVLSNPIASLVSAGKNARSKDVQTPVSWKDRLTAAKGAVLSKDAWLNHYKAFYRVICPDDARDAEDFFSDRLADFSDEHRLFMGCLTLFIANALVTSGMYAKYYWDLCEWQKAETQRIEKQKIEDEKKAAEQEAANKKIREEEAARQKKRADVIATIEMLEDELGGDFSRVADLSVSDQDLTSLLENLSRKVTEKVLNGPLGESDYLKDKEFNIAFRFPTMQALGSQKKYMDFAELDPVGVLSELSTDFKTLGRKPDGAPLDSLHEKIIRIQPNPDDFSDNEPYDVVLFDGCLSDAMIAYPDHQYFYDLAHRSWFARCSLSRCGLGVLNLESNDSVTEKVKALRKGVPDKEADDVLALAGAGCVDVATDEPTVSAAGSAPWKLSLSVEIPPSPTFHPRTDEFTRNHQVPEFSRHPVVVTARTKDRARSQLAARVVDPVSTSTPTPSPGEYKALVDKQIAAARDLRRKKAEERRKYRELCQKRADEAQRKLQGVATSSFAGSSVGGPLTVQLSSASISADSMLPPRLVQPVGCVAGDSNHGAPVFVANSALQGVRAVSDACGPGESSVSVAVPKVLRGLRPEEKFDVTDGGKTVEGVGIDQNTFTTKDLDPSQCYVLLCDYGTKVLWALKHDGKDWRTIIKKGRFDASTKKWLADVFNITRK